MPDFLDEVSFQAEIERELLKNGWVRGISNKYDSSEALYTDDLISFFQNAYPDQWQRFVKFTPKESEKHFVRFIVSQIDKSERGILDLFRKELKDRGTSIRLTAPVPAHGMNAEAKERFSKNIFRVVREVVYSPHGCKNRIDLVLFLNGLPVATIETKSEFKQDLQNAIKQYKFDRRPQDPHTKKTEPLLKFKRGALVHFAIGENEIFMTTKLDGSKTFFLPFNQGKGGLGAGNKTPKTGYPIKYFWEEILQKENLMNIIQNFIHLERKEVEDESGRKSYKETLIFPRYHQWEVVTKLLQASHDNGPGSNYLIQHSAGSGKSNSIAWLAHQLANLYRDNKRVFDTIIVVTDRTLLDSQLQETIFQFEHKKGVVSRIGNSDEQAGFSSKSEQLTHELVSGTNIVIVTIQTFPFVIDAIREQTSLKCRSFAVIADEAHSSQTGKSANKIRQALTSDKLDDEEEVTSEDLIRDIMESRGKTENISYFAFTATPKAKTLEVFGTLPDPTMPISEHNKPQPFHLYSMKQAIEEGFIRNVLSNYTPYLVLYELSQKEVKEVRVDSAKAKKKIAQFARIHPHNISQKIQIIVEHFRSNVAFRLEGQAKGMVLASSRKEAVRYKLMFDKYIHENSYNDLKAIVAFSGEIYDKDYPKLDSNGSSIGYKESNMNELGGRQIPEAFDSEDFQLLLVANKYQTGFDQPKLCAMYIDKKLGGVDCVQTLSRLNRTYPGKNDEDIFILDFVNKPEDIEEAFKPYFGETKLGKPSDPNLVYTLKDSIMEQDVIHWDDVEKFCEKYDGNKDNRSLLNKYIIPARDRFNNPYKEIVNKINSIKKFKKEVEDEVHFANLETELKELNKELIKFEMLKKNCTSFIRTYDFISQIIDFDDIDLEKFYLYLQALGPMLGRGINSDDEVIDDSNLTLSKYRIKKLKKAQIELEIDDKGLDGVTGGGISKVRSFDDELLSEIIRIINELHGASELTDEDKVKYFNDLQARLERKPDIIQQVRTNSREQMKEGNIKSEIEGIIIENLSVNETHKRMGENLLGENRLLDALTDKLLDRLFAKYKK